MSSKSSSGLDATDDVKLTDVVDLKLLCKKIGRGANQIIGFALLCFVLSTIIFLATSRFLPVTTKTRVIFAFPGFEKGEYPDKSKFQPDDLKSPAIIAEAMKRQNIQNIEEKQSEIRGGLSIEGIIDPKMIKERDRIKALGQVVPSFVPDEYEITLTVNRSIGLNAQQRENLLRDITNVYIENFTKTYGDAPIAFGNAFETLKNTDFPEYELVLGNEIDHIRSYLEKQSNQPASFRSQRTNLTFTDLTEQTTLFSEILLNETLGLIREHGLAHNRALAITKINFHLRVLEDKELQSAQQEQTVKDLFTQVQNRRDSYILGIKSQATKPQADTPLLDQGLIDSLIANDAYNLLVRKVLDAGLKENEIHAEKTRLIGLRDNIKSFTESDSSSQSVALEQTRKSLNELHIAYDKLIQEIRETQQDFARQQFADAIRFSDKIYSSNILKQTAIAGLAGFIIGISLGTGLSLIGIYIGSPKP